MRVLFLTLIEINSIEERGIYQDLLRKFVTEGHEVVIVSPLERRRKVATNLKVMENVTILQVKTFNIQKTNIFEKGLGTLAIEYQFLSAIKKHLKHQKFDVILYSTPPITFYKIIDFIKKRDNALAYLLLKDIFPQNAVDMKMIKSKSFLHNFFVQKEKKLYAISDAIGCMSQANVDFVVTHNPEITASKVEINPNSIEPQFIEYTEETKIAIKKKYQLPLDKKILIYGGNLGKPQGLEFLLQTIVSTPNQEVYFLIIGDGTQFVTIQKWFENQQPKNAKLIQSLPKKEYDTLLGACDVGLIFLHKDFTIPNFPSRLLPYLEMKMPVIAATDKNSDIGKVIEEFNCGVWVLTGDSNKMQEAIAKCLLMYDIMGENSKKLLLEKYTVENSYQQIIKRCN